MTDQDTRYTDRFGTSNMSNVPSVTAANFAAGANITDLKGYTPVNDNGVFSSSMLSDIGRAMIYGPENQSNPYSKFLKSPLQRGNASMTGVFKGVKSKAYDPLADDTELFNANKPEMLSTVISKNLDRTVDIEVNDRWLKQFVQTPEMIGDAYSAIAAQLNSSYLMDMYTASNEYFGASTHGALATQMVTLGTKPGDAGFADEFLEELYNTTQKDFKWKSTKFNALGYETKSDGISIIMDKSVEYKAFRKTYSETFHPDYISVKTDMGFVDSFPGTVAGKPSAAGDLLAIVFDNRAPEIIPMPDSIITESFRNPARHSTAFFMSYAFAMGQNKMFNAKYIFGAA